MQTWCCAAPWFLVFATVFVSSYFLSGTSDPSCLTAGASPLDTSWQLVLEYAAKHNFQFGRDIVFTYGPLGFLFTNIGQGFLVDQRVLFSLVFSLGAAWAVTGIARSLAGLTRYVFIFWVLIFYSLYSLLSAEFAFVIMAYGGMLLTQNLDNRKAAASGILVMLALLSLIKFTFFLAAVATVIIAATVQFSCKKAKEGLSIVVLFGSAVAALWLAAGQQAANFLPWVKGSIEVATGFNDAMSRPANIGILALCLVSGAIFLHALFKRITSPPLTVRGAGYLLLLALYTFLAWKQGFVRAHDHVLTFILFLPVAVALLYGEPREKSDDLHKLYGPVRFLVVVLLCAGAAAVRTNGEALSHIVKWPVEMLDRAGQLIEVAQGKARDSFPALKPGYRLPEGLALPLSRAQMGASTVDVVNFQQWAAVLNGLNYHPRPVIQEYTAFTPYLQDINLAALEGEQRPDFILFNVETVDNRFPTLDYSLMLPTILRNYSPVPGDKGFITLKKNTGPVDPMKLKLAKSQSVGFDQELSLADVSGTIFVMQIEMKPTLFGKLVSLLYHAPIISMTVRTGESILEKRMVPAMAKRGFLFNPLILSNADVLNFYNHKGATADAVSFSRPPLSWGQLSGTIVVNIYRLK